jgi:hypothetical protein
MFPNKGKGKVVRFSLTERHAMKEYGGVEA